MTWKVINGSSAEVLKGYPDNHFDSVVCDPPYGINFLGKNWDSNTGDREVYEQCYRVLKPGGHLLAFSAARTYHHLAMTVETVGFEIRDQIMWIYGSGFPKSQDVGRQINKRNGTQLDNERYSDDMMILQTNGKYLHKTNGKEYTKYPDINGGEMAKVMEGASYGSIYCEVDNNTNEWTGWGTNLKPAHEPIVMGRKPISEKNIAKNCEKYGTGAINIDATRVAYADEQDINTYLDNLKGPAERSKSSTGDSTQMFDGQTGFKAMKKEITSEDAKGRFPANVIHDGSPEVVSLFPHSTSGARKATHKLKGLDTGEQRAVFGDDEVSGKYNVQPFTDAPAESGSAARFFYCPKVSRKERHIGFDPNSQGNIIESEVFGKTPVCLDCGKTRNGSTKHDGCDPENIGFQERRTERSSEVGNNHPTVKPIELMKYLIKLVTPPNGHILDPFNGSGSTGCAAVELGYDYTGIELDPNYVEIATKRISHWESECKPKTTYNNLFEEK